MVLNARLLAGAAVPGAATGTNRSFIHYGEWRMLAIIQMMTEHFVVLGATDIPRDAFLAHLESAQALNPCLFP